MPPFEQKILEALRSHAELRAWFDGKDGPWAKVMLDDARGDVLLADMEVPRNFESALNYLRLNRLYRKIDDEHGYVDMGALPPESE